MSYYEKVLQPGEQVRFVGKLHWIIYKNVVGYLLLAAVFAVEPHILESSDPGRMYLATVLIALLSFLEGVRATIVQATTEFVVTDKRVIYKRGWISRRTEEINITKVESVDVDQDVVGRILGFGSVLLRGTGGSWEPLRRVADPLGLRNAILVG